MLTTVLTCVTIHIIDGSFLTTWLIMYKSAHECSLSALLSLCRSSDLKGSWKTTWWMDLQPDTLLPTSHLAMDHASEQKSPVPLVLSHATHAYVMLLSSLHWYRLTINVHKTTLSLQRREAFNQGHSWGRHHISCLPMRNGQSSSLACWRKDVSALAVSLQ